jgi:hypothetical protein
MAKVPSLDFEVFRRIIWPFIDKRRDFLKFLSPTDDQERKNYVEVDMNTWEMYSAFSLLRNTLKQTTWSRRQHENIIILKEGMMSSTAINHWYQETALGCVKNRGIILVPVKIDEDTRTWFLGVIDFSNRVIRHYDTSNSGKEKTMFSKLKVRVKTK